MVPVPLMSCHGVFVVGSAAEVSACWLRALSQTQDGAGEHIAATVLMQSQCHPPTSRHLLHQEALAVLASTCCVRLLCLLAVV